MRGRKDSLNRCSSTILILLYLVEVLMGQNFDRLLPVKHLALLATGTQGIRCRKINRHRQRGWGIAVN
jgi:hypothetical protein